MKRKKLLVLLPLFLLIFIAVLPTAAHANILKDVVDAVKDFFIPEKKEFKIDSNIALAPGGDMDRDGQIDSGDIIHFTYTISNTTDQAYEFATLKTNINRKQLNFIHNITGTASLDDDGRTITIPNFRIGANQVTTISFDARVNYVTNKDLSITTEAEFMDKDEKSITKAAKKEITAKKIKKEKIPGMLKREVKEKDNQTQ